MSHPWYASWIHSHKNHFLTVLKPETVLDANGQPNSPLPIVTSQSALVNSAAGAAGALAGWAMSSLSKKVGLYALGICRDLIISLRSYQAIYQARCHRPLPLNDPRPLLPLSTGRLPHHPSPDHRIHRHRRPQPFQPSLAQRRCNWVVISKLRLRRQQP